MAVDSCKKTVKRSDKALNPAPKGGNKKESKKYINTSLNHHDSYRNNNKQPAH